jgi:hypothetical protein
MWVFQSTLFLYCSGTDLVCILSIYGYASFFYVFIFMRMDSKKLKLFAPDHWLSDTNLDIDNGVEILVT